MTWIAAAAGFSGVMERVGVSVEAGLGRKKGVGEMDGEAVRVADGRGVRVAVAEGGGRDGVADGELVAIAVGDGVQVGSTAMVKATAVGR